MHAIDGMACAKRGCDNRGKLGLNIVGHGSFPTKWGRRWRYRCTVCGGTVSTNTATAYSGLRCARRECDQVASLRVEGVSISATARVTGPCPPYHRATSTTSRRICGSCGRSSTRRGMRRRPRGLPRSVRTCGRYLRLGSRSTRRSNAWCGSGARFASAAGSTRCRRGWVFGADFGFGRLFPLRLEGRLTTSHQRHWEGAPSLRLVCESFT